MTFAQPSELFGAAAPATAAGDFHDPRAITRVLKALLWLSIAVDVIATGSGLWEFSLLLKMQEGTLPKGEMIAAADASDLRQRIAGLTQIALMLVTTVVFARWIYILHDNKRRFGSSGLRFTPGWAIGWFFVPIANLWKPYQAMRELWQVSADPQHWQNQRPDALLAWWWILWVAGNVLGQLSFRMSIHATTIPDLLGSNLVTDLSDVVSIGLEFAALALVSRIAGLQHDRIRELVFT